MIWLTKIELSVHITTIVFVTQATVSTLILLAGPLLCAQWPWQLVKSDESSRGSKGRRRFLSLSAYIPTKQPINRARACYIFYFFARTKLASALDSRSNNDSSARFCHARLRCLQALPHHQLQHDRLISSVFHCQAVSDCHRYRFRNSMVWLISSDPDKMWSPLSMPPCKCAAFSH